PFIIYKAAKTTFSPKNNPTIPWQYQHATGQARFASTFGAFPILFFGVFIVLGQCQLLHLEKHQKKKCVFFSKDA
ncbi:MAG: hypothetical protein LBV54_07985, partial [Puniceicoccales bacterium]|nr:hypothetical protein [Puniceicoccales bacterium]